MQVDLLPTRPGILSVDFEGNPITTTIGFVECAEEFVQYWCLFESRKDADSLSPRRLVAAFPLKSDAENVQAFYRQKAYEEENY